MASLSKDTMLDDPKQKSFAGKYYPQELINSGGMSEIWLVTDGRGKPYALRKLKRELRFNFSARRRFAHGCEVLSKLNESDYIVGYVEHGKAGGTPYMLMDYVEAENLKELFAKQHPILAENVAQILIDAASGLLHVHESGFVHLDFKPENILVTRNGSVRLIDFDTAIPLPEKPVKQSKNPGTPGYMAPEQLQREPIDGRADIFSYGVTAYEILTNHKPYPGETPAEILSAQMNSAGPVPPREYNPEIPPALEKVILRCLACDPDRRYPYMSVLTGEVQKALYL